MVVHNVAVCDRKPLFLLLILPMVVDTLIVEGEIKTKEDWTFIARYCYRNQLGAIQYYFEYPKSLCCQKAVLYYDTQWPKVYPAAGKCEDKLAVTIPENNQVLNLDPREFHSGCSFENDKVVCRGGREFVSSRSRWWYVVLANCGKPEGVQIKYRFVMTNGDTFWTRHFSADERNILQPDICYLIVYLLMLGAALVLASILKTRQLFHYTYKLFLWSVAFELMSLILDVSYYVNYGKTGHPKRALKVLERGFHSVGDVVFLVMLILLAKGWTVTRGRISSSGQVKLGIFCTLYTVAYISLFVYEAKAFDPGEVLYLYESPAGVGLCVLRTIGWVWFCYGTFFTLKHYPQKHLFYYPFWFFYTLWFLSGPIFVLVATFVLESWIRAQVVNGIDRSVTFIAHVFFLILTRPSTANKNFPYHVRTSQVGIVEDNDLAQHFTQHAYAMSASNINNESGAINGSQMKTFSDISAIFRASTSPPPTINSKPVSPVVFNSKQATATSTVPPPSNGSFPATGVDLHARVPNGRNLANFHLFQASSARVPNGSMSETVKDGNTS